jgi:nicotinamide-nucleotide amidase
VADRPGGSVAEQTSALIGALKAQRVSVAVAESLTGGLVLAALTAVPGASAVVRGGAVVYATDTKHTMLGVDATLLSSRGPVDHDVARAMAAGVRARWGADVGLATTGVAGPEPQAGRPVGEVFVALDAADGSRVTRLNLTGGRPQIRAHAAEAALSLLESWLAGQGPPGGPGLGGEASG